MTKPDGPTGVRFGLASQTLLFNGPHLEVESFSYKTLKQWVRFLPSSTAKDRRRRLVSDTDLEYTPFIMDEMYDEYNEGSQERVFETFEIINLRADRRRQSKREKRVETKIGRLDIFEREED